MSKWPATGGYALCKDNKPYHPSYNSVKDLLETIEPEELHKKFTEGYLIKDVAIVSIDTLRADGYICEQTKLKEEQNNETDGGATWNA